MRKTCPFENVTTPYAKLKSLDGAERYLRPGVTFERLDQQAMALAGLFTAKAVNEELVERSDAAMPRPARAGMDRLVLHRGRRRRPSVEPVRRRPDQTGSSTCCRSSAGRPSNPVPAGGDKLPQR